MKAKMEQTPATNLNPVLSVTKEGTVLYSNEAGEPLLQEWGVRIGEKLPSTIREIVQRVISLNSPEKMEVKSEKKEYLVVFHPLPEQDCVNISGFDISDQKNLEERIQESEEKYRAIFENSIDAILLTTPDGTIQEANPAACQMFMMNEEEIIQAGRDGITDASDPRLKSFLEKRARIGKSSEEINHRRKDGTIFPGEVSSAFFKDKNGITRTAMIIRDVSERKLAEEALREREERFRSAFDDSAVAMALVCPDGCFLKVNDAFCQLLGFEKSEMEGRTFLDFTYPDDVEPSILIHKAVINCEKPLFWLEKRYIHKDGRVIWCEVSSSPVFNSKGCPIYTVAHIQDITERKQAEHQLSNELARAIGLYELYTRSSNLSDRELYDFALNQAVKITNSTIGFFHLVSEDEKEIILTTWNQEALRSCTAGKEGHYPIEKAGNWVDCVRLKRPVVYNDFPSSPNQKGLPVGHATVKRFMSVPVTENGKVRIVFGVGNKVDEYDDRDVMQLQLVATELHRIMKLRRIENEVRESEEKFRQMAENIGEVFFIFTPDWKRTVYVSPVYEQIWGRSLKDVYDNSMDWLEAVHPDDRIIPLAVVNKHIAGNFMETDTAEYRILRPDGVLRWINARTYPVLDEQGNVYRITGIAEDITERKRAEEALKKAHDNLEEKVKERTAELEKAYNSLIESEKGLAEAQEMAHIGNWVWDIATDKAYWSNELYRIFGRDPQKLAPTINEFYSYIHPDDRHDYVNLANKALNEKSSLCVDFRIISDDGEERRVYLQSKIIFNETNDPVQIKGIVQDITERKKAEEKIHHLANIVESSEDAIGTLTLDGTIISWNKGAEKVYGYSVEEILGKCVSILAPPHLDKETIKLIEKIKQREQVNNFDTLRLRKEGKTINVSITLSPVFDTSGKLTNVSFISRDITKRKEAEEALAKIEIARKQEIHHRIKNNLQVISSLSRPSG